MQSIVLVVAHQYLTDFIFPLLKDSGMEIVWNVHSAKLIFKLNEVVLQEMAWSFVRPIIIGELPTFILTLPFLKTLFSIFFSL